MKTILPIVLVVALLGIAFFAIYNAGVVSGARQMARHILDPAFETESFYKIMGEECGTDMEISVQKLNASVDIWWKRNICQKCQ